MKNNLKRCLTAVVVSFFLYSCTPTYAIGNIEVDYSKKSACENEVSDNNVLAIQCIQSDETLDLTAVVNIDGQDEVRPEHTVTLVQISENGNNRYFRRCHPREKCPEEDDSEAIIYGNSKLCVQLGCGEDTGPLGGYSFCVNKNQVKGGCID